MGFALIAHSKLEVADEQTEEEKDNYPRAVVRRVGGQLVLDDPDAVAVIHAVEKHNCRNTFELNADRVVHFKNRLAERGMTADQAVIVLLNVDDVHGGPDTTGRKSATRERSRSREDSPCVMAFREHSAPSTRKPRRS